MQEGSITIIGGGLAGYGPGGSAYIDVRVLSEQILDLGIYLLKRSAISFND